MAQHYIKQLIFSWLRMVHQEMKLVCKDYYMVKLQRNPQSGYTQITDSFILS